MKNTLDITVAMPLLTRYIASTKEYFDRKQAIYKAMSEFLTDTYNGAFTRIALYFNALDQHDRGIGGIYLSLTGLTLKMAIVSSVAAAVTVSIMTLLGLPVSTSQAAVGAILGIGFLNKQLNIAGVGKVVACWFGTPIGALLIAIVLYRLLAVLYNRSRIDMFESDILLRLALIVAGSYAAYALGANNVANVTAVFVGAGQLTVFSASLVGGLSIALGILTFSRGVMETVGKKLVRLDPFSALVVVLAEGLTVHLYALVGVPVSTSQAVIGAVLGVGVVRGINTVSRRTLFNILIGWLLTPAIACSIAVALYFMVHLKYVPG